ncbi:MAG: bifunctional germination protease/germinant receptor pseudoprotease CspBA [Peptostreptococcaceae bacterium]
MIQINFEVIVKYNEDILKLESELGVKVEILSPTYAIITSQDEEQIKSLLSYPQIEYIEKPFILETQDIQSFSSSGITGFKNRYNLTGKGTIIGIIDSGIDYTLPVFKDENGKTKILYYWDQSGIGTPPIGFSEGALYTSEEIDESMKTQSIPISYSAAHGTHVASIACQIANEANLIVVKVGSKIVDNFSRSTEFMRAVKFILDKALELKMPVAINISYGSNEGSHRGLSLFEQYIDDMCLFWKNNIVVAAGNNRDKGGHKNITLDNSKEEVEFVIGENEKTLNINIWPNFADDFKVYLINPSNKKTQEVSLDSGEIKNSIGSTKIKGYFYPIAPYSLQRRVTFQLTTSSQITPGIWKIVFEPIKIVVGNIDIYLPTSEGLSKDTRFLTPNTELTVTVPGTSRRVITVGSYNSRTDIVSTFSGEGDIERCMPKPDILAPGEDILSYLPGGNQGTLSGTSMATPHVTGVCSLLLEWGIVDGNDKFLYSAKLKSYLLKGARRTNSISYPDNLRGYGFLNLSNLDLSEIENNNNEYDFINRKRKNKNREYKSDERRNDIFRNGMIRGGISVVYEPGFEEEIKKLSPNVEFYKLSNSFGIVYINSYNASTIESVISISEVLRIEPLTKFELFGEISRGTTGGINANEEIGVNFFKNNPNLNLTGRGIIISIISSGIDYLHPDFIYPDGTSKILYIWDQTKEGNPPQGYNIGSEFTKEQINEAIKNNDKSLSTDEEGFGTMSAGICAGLGNVKKEYSGVAEDAELIVVKMAKIDGFYNNAMAYVAAQYIYQRAFELKMPLIINSTFGSNSLVGITTRIITETTFYTRGVCVVSAAGDEGDTQTHTTGKLEFTGDIKEVEIEIVEEEENLQIEIWLNRPDTAEVTIISPTGEESKRLEVTDYSSIVGKFDLEGTLYSIVYVYPTTFSGQQQTIINLVNAKKGIWKIKFVGDYITSGIYNVYLPNKKFLKSGTKFKNPNPDYTINFPATYNDTVTVGAYDSINKSLWKGSSRGPTISGIFKPDIIAPGVNIVAPYPGGGYSMITGTSPATSYTSGCIALFMQYILVDKNYPDKAFVQKIRTLISGGATREDNEVYPNNKYGYGVLNLRGMFDVFK